MNILEDYKRKQQMLLDAIPGEESKNVMICETCGDFVYLAPLADNSECTGCGDTYSIEIRKRL